MDKITLVCPCAFGVEKFVADEIKVLGYDDVESQNGRVIFRGDEAAVARANIRLRCAERVLILLGEFEAYSFEELFQGVKAINWEKWIGRDDAFPVKGWSLNSVLHSVPDCQSIIKKAAVEHLKSVYHIDWFKETGTKFQIRFSILKDRVSVYIDTSGEGLHKRGYRRNSGDAPLKETLAASMVKIARFYTDRSFCDPMCGSGTILIEAAMIGRNIAPGLNRTFAAEKFHMDNSVWKDARDEARSLINDEPIDVFGFDMDEKMVELTLENADKAGVGDAVRAERAILSDFAPPQRHGTLITNPPYGERMLETQDAEKIYKTLGTLYETLSGWRFYVISPSDRFELIFGRKADKKRKLYNGMIKCGYFQYFRKK